MEFSTFKNGLNTELVKSCKNDWTLAQDVALLKHLEQFSLQLVSKTEDTIKSLEEFESSICGTCFSIKTVSHKFQSLADKQFIEHRVLEDDVLDCSAEKKSSFLTNDDSTSSDLSSALTSCLSALHSKYEKMDIQYELPSESGQVVITPVTRYDRSLPPLYGSEQFLTHYSKENEVNGICNNIQVNSLPHNNEIKSMQDSSSICSSSITFEDNLRDCLAHNKNPSIHSLSCSEESNYESSNYLSEPLNRNATLKSDTYSQQSFYKPLAEAPDKINENPSLFDDSDSDDMFSSNNHVPFSKRLNSELLNKNHNSELFNNFDDMFSNSNKYTKDISEDEPHKKTEINSVSTKLPSEDLKTTDKPNENEIRKCLNSEILSKFQNSKRNYPDSILSKEKLEKGKSNNILSKEKLEKGEPNNILSKEILEKGNPSTILSEEKLEKGNPNNIVDYSITDIKIPQDSDKFENTDSIFKKENSEVKDIFASYKTQVLAKKDFSLFSDHEDSDDELFSSISKTSFKSDSNDSSKVTSTWSDNNLLLPTFEKDTQHSKLGSDDDDELFSKNPVPIKSSGSSDSKIVPVSQTNDNLPSSAVATQHNKLVDTRKNTLIKKMPIVENGVNSKKPGKLAPERYLNINYTLLGSKVSPSVIAADKDSTDFTSDKSSDEIGSLPIYNTQTLKCVSKNRAKIRSKRRPPSRSLLKRQSSNSSVDLVKELPKDYSTILSPSTDEEDLFLVPQTEIMRESSCANLFSNSLLSPGTSLDEYNENNDLEEEKTCAIGSPNIFGSVDLNPKITESFNKENTTIRDSKEQTIKIDKDDFLVSAKDKLSLNENHPNNQENIFYKTVTQENPRSSFFPLDDDDDDNSLFTDSLPVMNPKSNSSLSEERNTNKKVVHDKGATSINGMITRPDLFKDLFGDSDVDDDDLFSVHKQTEVHTSESSSSSHTSVSKSNNASNIVPKHHVNGGSISNIKISKGNEFTDPLGINDENDIFP